MLPTEVSERRVYVGLESHDVKAELAQLRKAPCVTVQVKVTSMCVCVYRFGGKGYLGPIKHGL